MRATDWSGSKGRFSMDDGDIEETLAEVREAFRTGDGDPEPGLDVDDPAVLQLRKSCRLLAAIQSLRARNGHYTVVIEAAFAAIERTIQFYLQNTELVDESDYVDHRRVYELGERAGLYGPEFRAELVGLWEHNRARTYYREGVGTDRSADQMFELAQGIHDHVLHLAGCAHECRCGGTCSETPER